MKSRDAVKYYGAARTSRKCIIWSQSSVPRLAPLGFLPSGFIVLNRKTQLVSKSTSLQCLVPVVEASDVFASVESGGVNGGHKKKLYAAQTDFCHKSGPLDHR
jgi:hypothetical protein